MVHVAFDVYSSERKYLRPCERSMYTCTILCALKMIASFHGFL